LFLNLSFVLRLFVCFVSCLFVCVCLFFSPHWFPWIFFVVVFCFVSFTFVS
jgi:hypothetical protein